MGSSTPETIQGDSFSPDATPDATPDTTPDTTPDIATDVAADTPPSPEDVASVIAELEQYRTRLVEDFTATAKKAKLPKSMAVAQLKSHPEILKIDKALAQLRGETPPSDDAA